MLFKSLSKRTFGNPNLLNILKRGVPANNSQFRSLKGPTFNAILISSRNQSTVVASKLEEKPAVAEATSKLSSTEPATTIPDVASNLPPSESVTAVPFSEPTLAQPITDGILAKATDFASYGLCNYTPVGLLEKIIEFVHIGCSIPLIPSIVATTIAIRVLMLPLIISLNKSATRIANVKPEMDAITAKVNRAKAEGDHYELALQSQNLRKLFKEHDLKPFRMMLLPFVQAPVMISFFLALRALAEAPYPSLLDGGMLWFTNLALTDPYYALPVISSLGFLAVFEMGSEMGAAAQSQPKWTKNLMRGLSLVMIPVTASLPSIVFMYWIPSSLFSMVQIYTLNKPSVRKALNMPELIKHIKKEPRKRAVKKVAN